MKKDPKEWIEEILDKNPDYTAKQVWDATHRWLELSYIEKYMENKNEKDKQEDIEGEDIGDIGDSPIPSRKRRRTS